MRLYAGSLYRISVAENKKQAYAVSLWSELMKMAYGKNSSVQTAKPVLWLKPPVLIEEPLSKFETLNFKPDEDSDQKKFPRVTYQRGT